jgi:hypothetical protein
MAHYAMIDENNVVTQVFVGKNEDEGGVNWENYYAQGTGQICKRTSYNTRGGVHYDAETNESSDTQEKAFRKNYAGIGYSYDADRDAFIPPKPFESWNLNEDSCLWESPIPYPEDGNSYSWDEENQAWKPFELATTE